MTINVTSTIVCISDGITSSFTTDSGFTSIDDVTKRLQQRVSLGWQKCGQYAITTNRHWAGEQCIELVEYHEVRE